MSNSNKKNFIDRWVDTTGLNRLLDRNQFSGPIPTTREQLQNLWVMWVS